MIHYKRIVLIGILLFCYPLTAGAEQYLCVSELITGFYFNQTSKKWEVANFKAANKYIISKSDDTINKFKVTKMDEKEAIIKCKDGFNEPGFLYCEGFGRASSLRFNKNNSRFIYTSPFGYYNVLPEINKLTDETSATPFIEIGKCSPF